MTVPALEVRDLIKRYPTGVEALKGVSLEMRAGEFFGLLGPNGAGKSTLIHCITGLARPTSGRVEIFGHDAVHHYREASRGGGARPAGDQPRHVPDARGDARPARRLLRHEQGRSTRPHRRAARGVLADEQTSRAHAHALGRDEAPAHARARSHASSASVDPRRAHCRCRHRATARAVAVHRKDQQRGHQHRAHHALPRGGRAPL